MPVLSRMSMRRVEVVSKGSVLYVPMLLLGGEGEDSQYEAIVNDTAEDGKAPPRCMDKCTGHLEREVRQANCLDRLATRGGVQIQHLKMKQVTNFRLQKVKNSYGSEKPIKPPSGVWMASLLLDAGLALVSWRL
ncbi:hypothetical protein FA13DRAFT_1712511 [Coprinellus micaceus]|uniref:Uncharacterized protein n=1 Tax=Coprinellus micaceus TaxID=71717 RepID=A0A4Y7T1T7_COPMI|nr:hypothetical protein FA13DRAFT_1712511 [Coprinellus micaceus]